MLILHLNIRSLINKIELVRHLLQDETTDALCLSETWLTAQVPDELIYITGYKLWRGDRPTCSGKPRGGGVCVYVLEKYATAVLKTPRSNADIEMLGISIEGYRTGVINCITVYRPPKGDTETALMRLDQLVSMMRAEGQCNLLIHGDFNLNYLNGQCRIVKKLKEWETKSGLKQVIRNPSRVSNVSSTLIDLCFVDIKHLHSTGLININLSDHYATFLIRKKG